MDEFLIHPAARELLCQHCTREYPVWFAPNELWNQITSDNEAIHFLCLTCFALLAESKGNVPTAWMVSQEHLVAAVFHPGSFVREEMEVRGWSIETLMDKSLLSRELLEEFIAEHRNITPIYARCLGAAFGTGHEFWLNLQQSWQRKQREGRE